MQHIADGAPPVQVSSTDWLKLVGIFAFLTDHVGLFFIEEADLFRAIGRIAAPIFFFLIGFARSRNAPWRWMALGAVLTIFDIVLDGVDEFSLNILLNFAAVRIALRWIDRYAATPLRLAGVAVLCVLLLPAVGNIVEYGSEGWLWALFGYAQRCWRDGDSAFKWARFGFAILAALLYSGIEIDDHEFEETAAMLLVACIMALTAALLFFQRRVSPLQPPAFWIVPIRAVSRYSLEIYAYSIVAMQGVAYAIFE